MSNTSYAYLESKSTEELKELSLLKLKSGPRKGCATPLARRAQEILWKRANCPFLSETHWENEHRGEKI